MGLPSWWLVGKDPKDKLPWQPIWPVIKIEDVPAASVLLYYNGNKWTEKEARLKGFPYKDPPFHTSFYLGGGEHLNQGLKAEIKPVADEFRSTRRVDVVTYPDLTPEDRAMICDEARKRKGRIYDIPGFARFGFPFLKEWAFGNFCSEQVAEIFDVKGFRVSIKEPSKTEPFRLWQFSNLYPKNAPINTLHIGSEYPGQKLT